MGYNFSSQIGRNLKGLQGMENAHKMGVSWGKIFAMMGGFLLIFFGAIYLAMRGSGNNVTSVFDEQARTATQSAEQMQLRIQADIDRQIQEKLKEAGQ